MSRLYWSSTSISVETVNNRKAVYICAVLFIICVYENIGILCVSLYQSRTDAFLRVYISPIGLK